MLETPCLDTKLISYVVSPNEKDHSLKALAERNNIQQDKAHDALNDVEVTLEVFKTFLKQSGEAGIRKFGLRMMQTPKFFDSKPSNGIHHIPVCIKKKHVFKSVDVVARLDMDYYNNYILPDITANMYKSTI